MADAAVEFLLDNLQQLLIYHTHLISDAKNQVEKLESDLRLFKAFLRDSTKKRRKDESLRELVRQIRDVVYEAEDIIDAFVTQAAESKSKSYFLRAFQTPVKLHGIATDIERVSAKVKDIYGDKNRIDFAALNVGDGGPEESEPPTVRQENVVGFEDEAEKIIGYLTEETQQLDVISIIGMPGLGKTTLAGKIFRDPAVLYEFPTRIWVYVSQDFTRKNILLDIMREFTRLDEDMYNKSDSELARLVASHLERGKFLIVMDDVWTAEDWEKLQIALPKSNKMGKVLITSRHVEVGRYANKNRLPHKLRFLTQEESWLLLQLEVFGKPECPPELEVLGKLIVDQCDRLPLAIVVIGGILVKKFSALDDIATKRNAWTKVSNSVSTYLSEDPGRRMEKIIALSYDKLPYHLRACFLYLGIFPEDFEMPVWKLIRMWIAEGFIQEKTGISLEETAENYVEDLINRNLLRVERRRSDGRVKTCRIHDMLRDFCIKEAGNERENFLQEMKRSIDGFEPSVAEVQKFRRLCIHSSILNFISSRPYGPRVRSFVCFSKEEVALPIENISAIPAAFKLLRVLEVKPIKFTKLTSDMYQLVHLRYLTLSIDLAILPAAFSKLWNIQTLVVDTTSRTLEIKADIWKMIQLRHLKTNASTILPKTGKSSKEGEKIRTLGTISPQSCTEEVFERARNLKKLGIRGRLAMLIDGKIGSFDSLGKLENLEKLKLINDVFPSPPSEGQLRGLPPPYKFPRKLKSLTLSDTFLDWSHMSILGLLENLEVLKLKDKSFMGKCWLATDGGFRRLEVLHIGRTDLGFWIASAHHFPRLRRLELRNCEELKEVPIGLAEIENFQVLDLYRTKFASASAKKIGEAKRKQEEQNGKVGVFKLSIFPVEE
ncbi:putative late blight resistance proteinR1A-10 [Sesamum alatum]|uniref:Late blight resistance proteinR1A-10 n=1 Tax=Sesamum alatum TaxID=300844 RepID=A0AAE2CXN5_9LAMI|nr:putative late blight resistance proteinR1A-10 [Sesamum alatum]